MTNFATIAKKVEQKERLTPEDAHFLFHTPDLIQLSNLANQVNRAHNQEHVFYNVNRHINPTNICVLSCKFCSFSRKPGDEGAYAYSQEEMIAKARVAVEQGATEVHMVGGLHPRWSFKHYLEMIRGIKDTFPELHIKAFTAVELDWFVKKTRSSIPEVLQQLVEAGLGSLPGGGAEIFHPDIREKICDTKVPAEAWLETHRIAHGLGLKSNATMLYGHIESIEHRIDHMARLRDLQDQTGGFNAFIPLSFQPHDNDMGIEQYTFGVDDLRTVAVARLFLDNFKNIKTYWIMSGQDISQLALNYGANDLDGTVTEEKISRMAGGRSGLAMSRHDIEDLITQARRTPVERDTLYNPKKISTPTANVSRSEWLSLVRKWEEKAELAPHEIGVLLEYADLNTMSITAQNLRPFRVSTSIDTEKKADELLTCPHDEGGRLLWSSLAVKLSELRTQQLSSLAIAVDDTLRPYHLYKLICFARTYLCEDIILDYGQTLQLSTEKKHQAINQDRKFKTLVAAMAYGVRGIRSAIEKDSRTYALLNEELTLLLGQNPCIPYRGSDSVRAEPLDTSL